MTQQLRVLVLGNGGREHALCRALRRAPSVGQVYCARGNPGTAQVAENLDCDPADFPALRALAERLEIDLLVPGAEAFIAAGVREAFAGSPVRVFAPGQAAGQLESSKVFGARFRQAHGIPSPPTKFPDSLDAAVADARALCETHGGVAVKADGLCAGKGVVVCEDPDAAEAAVREMLEDGRFGDAGSRVVLEARIQGEELSVLALVDGRCARALLPSQDYKRIFDGNAGPNTGGMGAYAPVPWADAALLERVQHEVLDPTVRGLRAEGLNFCGVVYAGLIMQGDTPLVLEYNVRFGDPETQAVLALLDSDLAQLMLACCEGRLADAELRFRQGASVCVVMASPGYPGTANTGGAIEGVDDAEAQDGVHVIHAGTKRDGEQLRTSGGRVLGVTSVGDSLADAVQRAHAGADQIHFEGAQRRRDIGRVGNGPTLRQID